MKLTYAIIFTLISIGYFETYTQAQYSDADVFKQMNPSAQKNNSLDSLKKLIPFFKEDTDKVMLLWKIGNIYMWSYPDSALAYLLKDLKLAQVLNFKMGMIRINHSLGEVLGLKGNFSAGLGSEFKALKLSESLNNQIEISLSFFWIGLVYILSADYQNALVYLYKTESNNEILSKNRELIFAHMGWSYFYLHKLDSALFYIKKSYDLEVKENNKWCGPYLWMARITDEMGRPAEALGYYHMSVNISFVKKDIIDAFIGMASAFKTINAIDSSIYYANKAIIEAQNESFIPEVAEASKLLTDIYKNKHFTDSTLKYEEIMLAAEDSLFSQEKVRQIQSIAFNEQVREQEIETEKTQYQNKIKLIVASIVAILVIAYFVLYTRKRELQKILLIRNRIARDLHDDVGTALSSISIFSDVINENLKTGDEKISSLAGRIGDNARQVIESMSDIIWAIKPSNESVAEMLIRMKQLCSNLFESKEIVFQFEADEKVSSIKLPMNYRRDMYLIFKEAINNIVKYAECKNVMIKMFAKDSLLQLLISDDGVGFDTAIASNGNGLQNMKTRAAAINGKITIESAFNTGTVVKLAVSIP